MMEEEFRPDGWLGLLIGSKLWISFTNPKALESDVNTLVRHIGSKCLVSEDDVVPVQEIPSSAILGKNGDQQSGFYQYSVLCFCVFWHFSNLFCNGKVF